MATIIRIEAFALYEEVGFYTIFKDENEESETDRFIIRFSAKSHPSYVSGYKDSLDNIVTWIDEIGMRGTHVASLRFENDALALPPKLIRDQSLVTLETHQPPLRLYCIKLSPQIIVLCGGGIKTAQSAQESPDLSASFRLANKVANELTGMIQAKEIVLEDTQLKADENPLELWLP